MCTASALVSTWQLRYGTAEKDETTEKHTWFGEEGEDILESRESEGNVEDKAPGLAILRPFDQKFQD